MSNLSIRRSPPPILAAVPWVLDFLQAVGDLITGPMQRITFASAAGRRPSHWRPLEVVVAEAAVLKTRVSIPRSALSDLPHAIDLLIRRETPFDPDELLVDAEQLGPSNVELLVFVVRLLPKARAIKTIARLGRKAPQIARLTVEESGIVKSSVNFAPGLSMRSRFTGVRSTIALVLCLLAGTYLWWSELESRAQQAALVQAAIAETSAELSRAARDIQQKTAMSESLREALSLFDPARSVTRRLDQFATMRPAGVSVSRLQIDADGGIEVALRSADILSAVQKMNELRPGSSALNGSLTADPVSGLEIATVSVAPDVRQ